MNTETPYDIFHGDVAAWAASYTGPKFHALLSDCPYELGFMGKGWDATGVSFRPATWQGLAAHLYPGAFGFVFAGTRTYHRIACAIEDAGLIIHPMICWAFGSGFPKATRIDLQADRLVGAASVVAGERQHAPKFNAKAQGYREKDNGFNSRERATFQQVEAGSDVGKRFAGYRYGLQAIKPALEPIIVFQKPYQGRAVENIVSTGAGALNIDAGRVGTDDDCARVQTVQRGVVPFGRGTRSGTTGGSGHDLGRWPANLVLAHHPDCNGHCVEGCAVRAIDTQVSGTADHVFQERAKFFYSSDWMLDRLDTANPVRYVAKPSVAEREAGLEGWEQTTVDDGRHTPIDNAYLRGETQRRNTHPTVKPLDLCRYLATLLLPPPEYGPRRLLVPFSGSGSEMIGAGIAGWEHIQGIELEADHVHISQARLRWWLDVMQVNEL